MTDEKELNIDSEVIVQDEYEEVEQEFIEEEKQLTSNVVIGKEEALANSKAAVEKYKELIAEKKMTHHHITLNSFGNIVSGVKVKLSDGSVHVSNAAGEVEVPHGLTVV